LRFLPLLFGSATFFLSPISGASTGITISVSGMLRRGLFERDGACRVARLELVFERVAGSAGGRRAGVCG